MFGEHIISQGGTDQDCQQVADLTPGETLNFDVSTDQFTIDSQSLINTLTSATTESIARSADSRGMLISW